MQEGASRTTMEEQRRRRRGRLGRRRAWRSRAREGQALKGLSILGDASPSSVLTALGELEKVVEEAEEEAEAMQVDRTLQEGAVRAMPEE